MECIARGEEVWAVGGRLALARCRGCTHARTPTPLTRAPSPHAPPNVAVHRHPTTGALLPLATIEYSEQAAALSALRSSNTFDGKLRTLGPKLLIALDLKGQIAHALLRDVVNGVPPNQKMQMHMQSQSQQLPSPSPQAAAHGSLGTGDARGAHGANHQAAGGEHERGRDGGRAVDATPQRDHTAARRGWESRAEKRAVVSDGAVSSAPSTVVDDNVRADPRVGDAQGDARRRVGDEREASNGVRPSVGAPVDSSGAKRATEATQLPPSSTRRGDWSSFGGAHEWRQGAAARSMPASEGENSQRDATAGVAPAARPSVGGSAPALPQRARAPLRTVPVPTVPTTLGKDADPRFDPTRQRPWSGRQVIECRKQRKLWLGDRGAVQKV